MIGTGTFETTEKIREYIADILNTGQISYGPYSRKFEQEFTRIHQRKYAILSNSGTSSLLVALQTLKELHGWQDGDEVIVPALTFVATVNVVLQSNLKPVLVDVEPDCYGIDTEKIEAAITPRTKAIIPVHTFGQPCDILEIVDIAAAHHDLAIIEDSCEAMFINSQGRPVGGWGDIACYSTYIAHLITTGVGGLALTDNPDYAKTMRSLVNHGLSYGDLSNDDNGFNPHKTRRDFVFERVGHSFRITEFEAALGLAQLDGREDMITHRQFNAGCLINGLARWRDRLQLPKTRSGVSHSYMMFPIVCKRAGVRDRLTRFLEQKEIQTRRMLPLTCQPVYRNLFCENDYPVAKWINENGFYIGCHQGLSMDDLRLVVGAFGEFFSSGGLRQ